ncbi:MAG: hypothetical protein IJU95_06165 [Treponema sp.]|nr:hypothetical protein [Treponema sp.]
MSYESVVEQVKLAPEEALPEISNFIDFIIYRYDHLSKLEEFNKLCAESQAWAKNVGLTEADIQLAKKEVRKERKRA